MQSPDHPLEARSKRRKRTISPKRKSPDARASRGSPASRQQNTRLAVACQLAELAVLTLAVIVGANVQCHELSEIPLLKQGAKGEQTGAWVPTPFLPRVALLGTCPCKEKGTSLGYPGSEPAKIVSRWSHMLSLWLAIAVGTPVARRPPHRPGRALISASGSYLG